MNFLDRFDISVSSEEARKRFSNRVINLILEDYLNFGSFSSHERQKEIKRFVATILGKRYEWQKPYDDYITDFFECLLVLENIYNDEVFLNGTRKDELSNIIESLIDDAESDLGIYWKEGKFHKKGAELLDEKLINDNLSWLREKGYESVVIPFEKALTELLKATKNPEVLKNVLIDTYEALEALSQIATGRFSKDLSANQQLLIKEVKASNAVKKILKEYISYANNFRHAQENGEKQVKINYSEAEFFVYVTGTFIRLYKTSQENK